MFYHFENGNSGAKKCNKYQASILDNIPIATRKIFAFFLQQSLYLYSICQNKCQKSHYLETVINYIALMCKILIISKLTPWEILCFLSQNNERIFFGEDAIDFCSQGHELHTFEGTFERMEWFYAYYIHCLYFVHGSDLFMYSIDMTTTGNTENRRRNVIQLCL